MIMSKADLAHTMSTLLSLDHVMTADLMKLKEETLAKMYTNYLQNAKEAEHKLERVVEMCKLDLEAKHLKG